MMEQILEQMMERLLAEIRTNHAEIETNNEKFEILRGTYLPDGYPPNQNKAHSRNEITEHTSR
jgi:hypothetical protein